MKTPTVRLLMGREVLIVWLVALAPGLGMAQFSRSDFGKASQFNVTPSAPTPTYTPSYSPAPSYSPPSGGNSVYQPVAPQPPQPSPQEIARQKRIKESIEENDAGLAESKRGNYRAAVKHYRRALELNPNDKVIRDNFLCDAAVVAGFAAKDLFEQKDYAGVIETAQESIRGFKEYLLRHPGDKTILRNIVNVEKFISDAQSAIQSQKYETEWKLKQEREQKKADIKLAAVKPEVVEVLDGLRRSLQPGTGEEANATKKAGANPIGSKADPHSAVAVSLAAPDFDGNRQQTEPGALTFLTADNAPTAGVQTSDTRPAVLDSSVVDLRDKTTLTVNISTVKGETASSKTEPATLEFLSGVPQGSMITTPISNSAEIDRALSHALDSSSSSGPNDAFTGFVQAADLLADAVGANADRQKRKLAYEQLAEAAGYKVDEAPLVAPTSAPTTAQRKAALVQLAMAAGLELDNNALSPPATPTGMEPRSSDNAALLDRASVNGGGPSVEVVLMREQRKVLDHLRSYDASRVGAPDSREDAALGDSIRRLKADPHLGSALAFAQNVSLVRDQTRLSMANQERESSIKALSVMMATEASGGTGGTRKAEVEKMLRGVNEEWRAACSGALRLGYDELRREIQELAKELPASATQSQKGPAPAKEYRDAPNEQTSGSGNSNATDHTNSTTPANGVPSGSRSHNIAGSVQLPSVSETIDFDQSSVGGAHGAARSPEQRGVGAQPTPGTTQGDPDPLPGQPGIPTGDTRVVVPPTDAEVSSATAKVTHLKKSQNPDLKAIADVVHLPAEPVPSPTIKQKHDDVPGVLSGYWQSVLRWFGK
jgi:tetratricopeptide (TPR) repeat protein